MNSQGLSASKTMNLRRGIIFAFVICSTFLVAHIINAVLAEALSVSIGPARAFPASDREADVTATLPVLVERIRTSGLFPLPPDPLGISTTGSSAPPRAPLNLASKLKLLGVVIGDREGVSAIVEELSSKRQLFFKLHDQIPDAGEISEIRRDGIVVRQGDQQELLELAALQTEKPPSAPVAAGSAVVPVVPGSPVRTVLDRREVELAMGDLPKLLSQARAVPYLVNGAMNGFRLDYIAPSSFYEKIGLKYGDVLQQVNGVDIRDPGTMLTLFQQLRNEKNVKLDVLRNNQRTAMTFDIR